MKKKIKKENAYEKYGLDIPDKIVDEAEKEIDGDTIIRMRNTIDVLQKKVEELKNYKELWEKFKNTKFYYTYDRFGHVEEDSFSFSFKEIIEHTCRDVEEYTEFMENKYLK